MAVCCHNNDHNHNKTKQNKKNKTCKDKKLHCVFTSITHEPWTTFGLVPSSEIVTLPNAKWWNLRFTFKLVQQRCFVKMTWKFCHRRIKFDREEWVDVYRCLLRYKDSLPDVHPLSFLLLLTYNFEPNENTDTFFLVCLSVYRCIWKQIFGWIIIFKEFSQSSLAPCISPLKAL